MSATAASHFLRTAWCPEEDRDRVSDLGLEVSSGDGHNVTDWCLEQFHERYGDESPLKAARYLGEDRDRIS